MTAEPRQPNNPTEVAAPDPFAPRHPLTFSLGVTGHRSELLGLGAAAVAERIKQALRDIRLAVTQRFAPDAPRLVMVSPLADGADQLAADSALALEFELHALLPFSLEQTRAEVAEPFRGDFDRLAEAATCVIELGANPDEPLEAYVAAGEETITRSDFLLAVWDGQAPRGRGGTGEVVGLAIADGTPIVHIPIDPAKPLTLMWSGFGRVAANSAGERPDRRPFNHQQLSELLELLLPIKG